jgi:hypothetical protein
MSPLLAGFVSRHLHENWAHDNTRVITHSDTSRDPDLSASNYNSLLHLYPLYSGYLNHSLELVPTSLSFLRWGGQAAMLILGFAGDMLPASVLGIDVFPQQCRRSVHQRKTLMALLGLPGG